MNALSEELRADFRDEEYAYVYVEEFLNAEIATQLKVLREERGLTQQELAALTGMSQPTLSRLEDVNYGAWSIKTLKKLARAFDVTLKVSFETFSSRIEDIVSFNRESLQRAARLDDLSNIADKDFPIGVIDMRTWASKRNAPTDYLQNREHSTSQDYSASSSAYAAQMTAAI